MTSDERAMEAVRRVIVELANILRPFWDHIAVVGGLAAYLHMPQDEGATKHRGTTDIDLALDHERLQGEAYLSIRDILLRSLYQEDPNKAFRWHRVVSVDGTMVDVPVDFLAGSHGGTEQERDHQDTQEILLT